MHTSPVGQACAAHNAIERVNTNIDELTKSRQLMFCESGSSHAHVSSCLLVFEGSQLDAFDVPQQYQTTCNMYRKVSESATDLHMQPTCW